MPPRGGGKRRLTLGGGKTLDVNIPAGIGESQSIRLKGQGDPGWKGAPPGDAILKVHIVPHPFFTRQGDNIHVEVPVTLSEALSGAKIEVPTLDGNVTMTVPKRSNSGNVLRLKGRGIGLANSKRRGDQFVKLMVVLPDKPDDELSAFAAEWERAHPYAVRGNRSGD